MAGYEDANAAIESRFNTNWATATPIKFDNVAYEPTAGTTYVELQIHWDKSKQVSLEKTPLHRAWGIISVNIYTALNTGTKTAEQKADTAATIFRNAKFSGITCKSPEVKRIGEVDGWFVYNMNVIFHFDKTY